MSYFEKKQIRHLGDFNNVANNQQLPNLAINIDYLGGKFQIITGEKSICPLFLAIVTKDIAFIEEQKKRNFKNIDPSSKYCANLHPYYNDSRNWTYLSYAVFEESAPIVRLLLSDIRVVRGIFKDQYQSLRWALEQPNDEIIEMILDVLIQDKNEPTSYDLQRIQRAFVNLLHYERNKSLVETKDSLPKWMKTI